MNLPDGLRSYYHELARDDKPIHFYMPEKAVSKERPRAARGGHHYTPKKTRDYEKGVRAAALEQEITPYCCPVSVVVWIFEKTPKSYTKAQKDAAEKGLIYPRAGDIDNKIKAITDALNGVAYLDDRQITDLSGRRRYGVANGILVCVARSGISDQELREYVEITDKSRARLG